MRKAGRLPNRARFPAFLLSSFKFLHGHSFGLVPARNAAHKIDEMAILPYLFLMKTTIDLPDDLLHRAKVAAAQRKTTLKELVQTGLDWVLRSSADDPDHAAALARLQKGLRLGGKPLTRDQTHARR